MQRFTEGLTMKTGRGWWALAGSGVLMLLGLYVRAYFAMVRPIVLEFPVGVLRDSKYTRVVLQEYRWITPDLGKRIC